MIYYLMDKNCIPFKSGDDLFLNGKSLIESIKVTLINRGDYWFKISTVFLSLDHNFSGFESKPVLFETRIFSNHELINNIQARTTSKKKSLRNHSKFLRAINLATRG